MDLSVGEIRKHVLHIVRQLQTFNDKDSWKARASALSSLQDLMGQFSKHRFRLCRRQFAVCLCTNTHLVIVRDVVVSVAFLDSLFVLTCVFAVGAWQ